MWKRLVLSLCLCCVILLSGCMEPIEPTNGSDPPDNGNGQNTHKNDTRSTVYNATGLYQALAQSKRDDVILVHPGIYQGTFFLNESVTIQGSSYNSTIFDTSSPTPRSVFLINNDSCVLQNLTIMNSYETKYQTVSYAEAVLVQSSDNRLENIVIKNFSKGIIIEFQQGNHIINSTFHTNHTGVEIWGATANQVKYCEFHNCSFFGVYVGFNAKQNQISFSRFYHNDIGVGLKQATRNSVYRNTFINCRNPYHECCGAADNDIVLNEER